ncbi:hypothetical protein Tco_0130487, partial [Tanacetum coccineum]
LTAITIKGKGWISGNNYTRVHYNYFAKKAHPSAHMNMVPIPVLMKTGLRSLNIARPVNIAHPKTIGHPQNEDQGYVDSALLGSHKWTRTKKLLSLEDTRQKSSSKDNVN